MSIRFALDGDLRFISHHDTLRMMERALSRAEIPVARSQGFNPRPKISLPVPRSVGIASLDERLLVELSQEIAPDEAERRLAPQLPAGIRLLKIDDGPENVQPHTMSFAMALRPEEVDPLRRAVERFLSEPHVFIKRVDAKTGREKPIDIRAFVTAVEVRESALEWTQDVTPDGTVKPAEVLSALDCPPGNHLHRLVRTAVSYDAPRLRSRVRAVALATSAADR